MSRVSPPAGASSMAALAVAAVLLAAWPAAAQQLACPLPQPVSGPGVLRETTVQFAETGSFLADGNDPNRVPDVIADLRGRYPGASDAEIENYLIAAYCPQVAKLNGLTTAEQDARVGRFAQQVEVALHRN